MSIRKKYWKKVEKALLDHEAKKAAEMVVAIISGDIEKASELYVS